MLLSEARTRVARNLDDEDNDKFAVAEIDDALRTALDEVWQHVVSSGANIFHQEASISTSSSGVALLTTIKPIKLVAVSLYASGSRYNVTPARFDEAPRNYSGVQTLRVVYVPRVSFPALAGDAFVWGHANITSTATLDQLVCLIAASDLAIKEGEVNKGVELRKTELKESLTSTISQPAWSVMPMDSFSVGGRNAGFRYVMTAPDTLQLVYV